jgi:hypothetical protein
MGQDSEEAAEFVATVRTEHAVMKTWYMGSSSQAEALRQKHGSYPSLWKEVLNWPGWKESRGEYLRFTQTQGQRQGQGQSQAAPSSSEGGNEAESVPRKRKSRWGKASSNDDNNNADPTARSKPRWGTDPGHAASGGQPQPAPGVLPPPPGPPIPGMVLPGMPENLPPHKQEEMRKMQARLREINDKMTNLEPEAARVDALPRGHRERSPSPPPGTSVTVLALFVLFACCCWLLLIYMIIYKLCLPGLSLCIVSHTFFSFTNE